MGLRSSAEFPKNLLTAAIQSGPIVQSIHAEYDHHGAIEGTSDEFLVEFEKTASSTAPTSSSSAASSSAVGSV